MVFQRENDEHYYILNNDNCLKYIADSKIDEKQNNFQIKLFNEIRPLKENEFIVWIKNWLINTGKNI
jgi:hypothetical protein